MEGIIILLVLAVFGLPIVAIAVALRGARRIDRLERLLRELEARLYRRQAEAEHPELRPTPPRPAAPAEPSPVLRPLEPQRPAPPSVTREPPPAPLTATPPSATPPIATPPAAPLPAMPRPGPIPPIAPERPAAGPVAPARPPAAPPGAAPPSVAPPGAAPSRPEVRAARRRRVEEQLGARLPVWIGSIALFLAGAYLVKYTFDAGLLTPRTRVLLGAAFGLLLLGGGEWLRQRAARIAQGVTAAGIADLFASELAALRLYHLVSPPVGFALLGLTAGAAVVLSLRQGPFVALLGLLAGFATPALIGAAEPQPGPLFAYLFALEGALLVVTRRRQWWPLAALALAGALTWAAIWLLGAYQPEDSAWVGSFLIASIAAFIAATYEPRALAESPEPGGLRWLALAGAGAGVIMLAFLVGAGRFAALDWGFLGVLSAATLVLARIDGRYEPLTVLTALAGLALLAAWHLQPGALAPARFGWTALALGALHAVGGYVALWRAARPAFWAGLSVAAALGYLLVAYWVLDRPPAGWRWGTICLLIAAAYAAGSAPLLVARHRALYRAASEGIRAGPASSGALAALLVGVTTLLSLAVPIELEREWIAVAWALEIPALALLCDWLRLRTLRVLAAGLAALVALRLLQPGVLSYPLGTHPLWNWILYGYGLPAAAFGLAAWRFERQGVAALSRVLEIGAVVFGFVLVTLEVRHYFHPADIRAVAFGLRESSAYATTCLVLGGALLGGFRSLGRPVWQVAGHVLVIGGALWAVIVSGLALNPLWVAEAVGTWPVLNDLLYLYGLPALLALLLSGRPFQPPGTKASQVAAAAGVALLFTLLSLEVRQSFQGTDLRGGAPALTEWSTYASGWIILGALLLEAARRWQRDVLRAAGYLIGGAGLLLALLGPGLLENPLWQHHSVGTRRIFNALLYIYGLPALLAFLAALHARLRHYLAAARSALVTALLLLFLLVTLQVRQWFRGEFLDGSFPAGAESYAYSAAWVALGTLLLVLGIITRGLVLRWASLAVMLVAICKVFLLDTSRLRDLYRVLSLLGLGLSLLLLAFLYQRFVFGRGRGGSEGLPSGSESRVPDGASPG